MGRRGEHSKAELSAMALDAAVDLLEDEGPEYLTTRSVAARIGYSVGSLYFLFRNRDDLVLQVNGRTLDELGIALDEAASGLEGARLELRAMGRAYQAFAAAHPARWRLVFEHRLPPGSDLPPDHAARVEALFSRVAVRIAALAPSLDPAGIQRSAQALWGGVHGVSVLAVTDKLSAGGQDDAAALIEDLMNRYLDGLAAGPVGIPGAA